MKVFLRSSEYPGASALVLLGWKAQGSPWHPDLVLTLIVPAVSIPPVFLSLVQGTLRGVPTSLGEFQMLCLGTQLLRDTTPWEPRDFCGRACPFCILSYSESIGWSRRPSEKSLPAFSIFMPLSGLFQVVGPWWPFSDSVQTPTLFLKTVNLFLAVLGLHCCTRAFSHCSVRAPHCSGVSLWSAASGHKGIRSCCLQA